MPTPNKPKLMDYAPLAKAHGATHSVIPAAHQEISPMSSLPHESPDAYLPPELQRIEHAVGATYKLGQPLPDGGVASVGRGEPHVIEINDRAKWNQAPLQTKSHEITHLAMNQMAGPILKDIPPDDPKHPYNISDVDQLRAKGLKLWQLPQEKAAMIVQTYVADPSQRKRLWPWIQDMNSAPLSVENPVSPNAKGIQTTPRPPVPPIEAYLNPAEIKARAAELQAQFRKAGVSR
jgi:hypothetical protein